MTGKGSGPRPITLEDAADSLTCAWEKYQWLFRNEPHGTRKQMRALLELASALKASFICAEPTAAAQHEAEGEGHAK